MGASSFEKSVKGATKSKNAAPKSKYIEHILTATYTDAGIADLFRILQIRLRESAWTIVFKSLIVIHMMIREGSPGLALRYLSQNPSKMAITSISDSFYETKTDYVRGGQGKLKALSVSKGLLRETEVVQKQIKALLQCDLLCDEPENEITLTAFRLITLDLLTLYSVMNEGVINVLEHYFEMSRPDSERAFIVYKTFSELTKDVVNFLRVARRFENATRLEIPNLKHASTDLTKLLEDDLNDPDFALRRKEYRAQKSGKAQTGSAKVATTSTGQKAASQQRPSNAKASSSAPQLPPKAAPAPDLIDFFGAIEQNQQPLGQQSAPPPQQLNFQRQPQPQQFQPTGFILQQTGFQQTMPTGLQQNQTGFQQPLQTGLQQNQAGFGAPIVMQHTNPFAQLNVQPLQQQQQVQPNPTGAGFGGYTPQPQLHSSFQPGLSSIPQDGIASFQRPNTATPRPNNPFRQSMLLSQDSFSSPQLLFSSTPLSASAQPALKRQSTNPFAKQPQFQPQNSTPFSQSQQQQQTPLIPQRTGTNPFARSVSAPMPTENPPAPMLRPNPTGSTNPFRQSAFVNQTTGQGWQSQQGTIGGIQNIETVPVFPRPGQTA
ncbi:hypothetical protein FQN57_005305 [Myotisia sp. PD_48]|nr:hypothetical protein FQN57_005305 [Myotisia sp. PD_48]